MGKGGIAGSQPVRQQRGLLRTEQSGGNRLLIRRTLWEKIKPLKISWQDLDVVGEKEQGTYS